MDKNESPDSESGALDNKGTIMTNQIEVIDNASGAQIVVNLDTYPGDTPEDLGYDPQEVTWVNDDYARQDPHWTPEVDWPEGVPHWEARI